MDFLGVVMDAVQARDVRGGRRISALPRRVQGDAGDMPWTFPTSAPTTSPPTVPELRRLLAAAVGALADRHRHGLPALAIAPAPAAAARGWNHVHPYAELFIQCAGRSHFACPDGDLILPAGQALLFPALSAHDERVHSYPFANLVVTIRSGMLGAHLTVDDPKDHRLRIIRPDVIECDGFGEPCLSAIARSAGKPALQSALLLACCAWIDATLAAAPPPGDSGPDRVRQVRELIEARLGSLELSVSQLARWAGCHPDHLARSFRRATGETLVGYIQRRRLELARDLLADPRCQVREAARRAGFADPAYFSRAWRKRYGKPPSAHR